MANGLEHAPHFAVAPLGNRDPIPAIGPFTTTSFDGPELGNAIIKGDPLKEAFFFFVVERTQHADSVFALQAETGMHQLVGQFTGAGQKQQAFRVQIKTSD